VVLGVLSVIGGFVEMPRTLGGVDLVSRFLAPSFAGPLGAASAAGGEHSPEGTELLLQILSAAASLAGIGLAWLAFGRRAGQERGRRSERLPGTPRVVERFWRGGWGFDALYGTLLVRPFLAIAAWNRDDVVDLLPRIVAALARGGHRALARTQTGRVRWYAAALAGGGVLLLALAIWVAWAGGPSLGQALGGGGVP
jgi:NADH-quinone oxidoreductase subunit L